MLSYVSFFPFVHQIVLNFEDLVLSKVAIGMLVEKESLGIPIESQRARGSYYRYLVPALGFRV
jgi:hypothetical protein